MYCSIFTLLLDKYELMKMADALEYSIKLIFRQARAPDQIRQLSTCVDLKLSLCMRKPTIWVPTRSDTNPAVQSQKMVRGGKFWI